MKRTMLAACAAMIVLTAGGCANAGGTSDLTAAPETVASVSTHSDAEIMKMLPKGVKTEQVGEPTGASWKLQADFAGDGKKETVAFFSRTDESGSRGFVFLKEDKDGLVKVAQQEEVAPEINWGGVVTSPGNPPLLAVGWHFGAAAGTGMEFYRYDGQQFKTVARIFENKVQILTDKDGTKYMAVWQNDTGDAYAIRFVTINSAGKIVPYTPQDVSIFDERIASYQKSLKAMPEAVFYWYYLADAQLQAGHVADASASLAKAEEFKIKHPSFYPGNVLLEGKRAEILMAEKKFGESATMLNKILKNKGTDSQVQDDTIGFFGSKQAAFAQIYIDLGDTYRALKQDKDATAQYKLALAEVQKSDNWTDQGKDISVYSTEMVLYNVAQQRLAGE